MLQLDKAITIYVIFKKPKVPNILDTYKASCDTWARNLDLTKSGTGMSI